jgi:hypothetical protein
MGPSCIFGPTLLRGKNYVPYFLAFRLPCLYLSSILIGFQWASTVEIVNVSKLCQTVPLWNKLILSNPVGKTMLSCCFFFFGFFFLKFGPTLPWKDPCTPYCCGSFGPIGNNFEFRTLNIYQRLVKVKKSLKKGYFPLMQYFETYHWLFMFVMFYVW